MAYPFKRDKWTPPVVATAKKPKGTDADAAAADVTTGSQPKKARLEDPADEEGREPLKISVGKYSSNDNPTLLEIIGSNVMGPERGLLIASLARATWAKHRSAFNCYKNFAKNSGSDIVWPMSIDQICKFVSWALLERNLKPSTVKSYLSSLEFMHKIRNLECYCKNFTVQSIIKGAENLNMYSMISVGTRRVMTLPLLKIIGHQIAKLNWSAHSKLILWGACTLAFFGSLRLGEILAPTENCFNPLETLLWSDLKFRPDSSILLHVKIDKSKNKTGSYVDIFSFDVKGCCPVKTLTSLQKLCKNSNDPVFVFKNGKLLTPKLMNNTVRLLLRPVIGEKAMQISGHSFRAGIPSALASDPKAAKDSDIKAWGRWSSDSYLLYTRLKLNQKKILFEKIVAVLIN